MKKGYVFDNAEQQAQQRMAALPALYDPGTIRHLTELGVGEGWRCAEIGFGSGSIAEWLSRRVGPTGHVVATDIETKFLGPVLRLTPVANSSGAAVIGVQQTVSNGFSPAVSQRTTH